MYLMRILPTDPVSHTGVSQAPSPRGRLPSGDTGCWLAPLLSQEGPIMTATSTRRPTQDQLLEWMQSLSNWGRWGDDDQRGTLNLITPEKTKRALGLVEEGV